MPVRVAINGFGRIGRSAFKAALEEHPNDLEIVAINDLTSPEVLAHLLKYDTAYGHWDRDISFDEKSITVDGKQYPILTEKEPANLPWESMNVDVVIESTGRFTDHDGMQKHIQAGAKRVVLSAPAKGDGVGTYIIGVNEDKYNSDALVNNGSCTTNCIAPVAAIIQQKFGIQKALMTTVHSITAEQNLVDGPPPGGKSTDLRRARAAYGNMIPTTTGAAVAVTEAMPELKGLFDGRAIRVPTIVGSISDFTFLLKNKTSVEEVNQAIKTASEDPRWLGVVAWTEEQLVSSDIIGRSESSIVDLSLTQLVDGDLLKLFAWYDNEWGYANRLVEQVINVGKSAAGATVTPVSSEAGHVDEPAASSEATPKTDTSDVHSDIAMPQFGMPPGMGSNPTPPAPTPSAVPENHPPFKSDMGWNPSPLSSSDIDAYKPDGTDAPIVAPAMPAPDSTPETHQSAIETNPTPEPEPEGIVTEDPLPNLPPPPPAPPAEEHK